MRLDETAPRKERHIARRVFERLCNEHGYEGSESQVRRYLAENDTHHREVSLPLSQPPGEAQFDFGEAVVEIAGTRRKVALAVMCLPYSNVLFVSAFPRECTETFQKSHDDFLVPVPSFESFAELNAYLARRCEQELDRRLRDHSESESERLESDRASRARSLTPRPTRSA